VPKQSKEASVPRKCNVLIFISNNTSLAARQTRTRVVGGYDSTREGAWGAKYLFYIFLPFLVLMENISYMSFLGEGHVDL
jgi:hypothetical protein